MTVPDEMVAVLAPFAPAFFQARVFAKARLLVWGTILAHGPRTVTAALRAVGRGQSRNFSSFHRVLSRSRWAPFAAARILLGLLVSACAGQEWLVVTIDDFIERRVSNRLANLGAYRDPIASSKRYTVTCFGLRWLVVSLCVRVPGAVRVWALPFVTLLCRVSDQPTRKSTRHAAGPPPRRRRRPSKTGLRSKRYSTARYPIERTEAERKKQVPSAPRRHKTSTDLAAQVLTVLARWLPGRKVVAVLDGAFLSYKLLRHATRVGISVVTRGQARMVIHARPGRRRVGARGTPPSRGARIGSLGQIAADPTTTWRRVKVSWYGGTTKVLEVATGVGCWTHNNQKAIVIRWVLVRDPEARSAKRRARTEIFITTAWKATASQVIAWYVMRWSTEVTFEEARRHLGIETQRQSSPRALARTTPSLLGLFSLVTLLGIEIGGAEIPIQGTAWYAKPNVTFSDALACVRRRLWEARLNVSSGRKGRDRSYCAEDLESLLDAVSLAA